MKFESARNYRCRWKVCPNFQFALVQKPELSIPTEESSLKYEHVLAFSKIGVGEVKATLE